MVREREKKKYILVCLWLNIDAEMCQHVDGKVCIYGPTDLKGATCFALFGVGGCVIFRGFCSMFLNYSITLNWFVFPSIFRHLRCAFVDVCSRDARDLTSVAKLRPPPKKKKSKLLSVVLLAFLSFFSHAATVPVLHKLSNLPSSPAHDISWVHSPTPLHDHAYHLWVRWLLGGGSWFQVITMFTRFCQWMFVSSIATWFTGTVVRTKLLCVFCFYPHTHSFSEVLFHI